MDEFRISISIAHLLPSGAALQGGGQGAFPNLAFAVKTLTEHAHSQWVAYASGAPLPNGRSVSNKTGTYARSIMLRQLGEFQGEVYTELPYARVIEHGAPARDMTQILGRSLKVRISKKGKRYLIIPFRSYGPTSNIGARMPQAIHDWWKGGDRVSSHITSVGWRASGTGAIAFRNQEGGGVRERRGEIVDVTKRNYSYGSKLTKGDIERMGLGNEAVRRFAGMYRFDKPASDGKAGGGHSQFINFRVMMEGSKGWRAPARPGLHIAETVAKQIEPIAEKAFEKAVQADVEALLKVS